MTTRHLRELVAYARGLGIEDAQARKLGIMIDEEEPGGIH